MSLFKKKCVKSQWKVNFNIYVFTKSILHLLNFCILQKYLLYLRSLIYKIFSSVSATLEEELFGLKNWIAKFRDELAELSDNMSCEHDEERVKLSSLKIAYNKKTKRYGVYEAERMVAMNDKLRYIHD